ncbi:hypothetical protein BJF78_13825 [Pseudonocardia sp. CNS-139]|nr:hypothetical protein BJF78_13825 [Pseudonocardia sp. CNS-139]
MPASTRTRSRHRSRPGRYRSRPRRTVLAAPLVAPCAVPPVDRSAMDATPCAAAARGPWSGRCWRTARRRAAAARPGVRDRHRRGRPARDGRRAADEDAVNTAGTLTGAVERGRNVRRAGEECAAGTELLPAGAVVRPAVLGLAATIGRDSLLVHPRPRVTALVTGDELVDHGPPGPGRVRDAIGPMLPGLVERAGGVFAPAVRLPDTRGALVTALATTDATCCWSPGRRRPGPPTTCAPRSPSSTPTSSWTGWRAARATRRRSPGSPTGGWSWACPATRSRRWWRS